MNEDIYCLGCGIKLQSNDENKEGYIPSKFINVENSLCKRCYQLKHYGKFVEVTNKINPLDILEKNVKEDDLICLIVDCMLVNTPIINEIKKLSKYHNILVIANRYDLVKSFIKIEKIYEFLNNELKKSKLHILDTIVINNNFEYIFDKISFYSIGKDVYFVGLENAGKTTFINNLLKNITNENDDILTNSKYPGTTIDLIKIPLDENDYLIDSPGIISKGNINHNLELELIKKLNGEKKLTVNSYQLNGRQTLAISNFIKVDIEIKGKETINLYFPSLLEVNRYSTLKSINSINHEIKFMKIKSNNVDDVSRLTPYKFELDNYYQDIVIEGLGFIRAKNVKIIVNTFKNVNVFVRKSMI